MLASKLLQNSVGSALLEAAIACVAAGTIVSGGLSLLYLNFARLWIDRAAYESLICLARMESETRCRHALTEEIKTVLPIGHLERMHVSRSLNRAHVGFDWVIHWNGEWTASEHGIRLRQSHHLGLPIQATREFSWPRSL